MMKRKKQVANSMARSYRVECNHGSKYFVDEDRAKAYHEYLCAQNLDAEFWLVWLYYDASGELVKGVQTLMSVERDEGYLA